MPSYWSASAYLKRLFAAKFSKQKKNLVLCECCSRTPAQLKEAAPLPPPCAATVQPPRTAAVQPPRTAAVQPPDTAAVQSPHTPAVQRPRTTTVTRGSPEVFRQQRVVPASVREDNEQLPGQIVNYVPTDGEVQLGRGIAVYEGVYSRLMSTKSETRFVREAAVAIFSTAGLVGRSVTGAASNRTKGEAKPPLDKEKYTVLSDFFNHFLKNTVPIGEVNQKMKVLNKSLANKINDLMKSKD
ncbi:uncharacterized protein LOC119388672 [Rhipicephalus sanguineus]|uniref:uncharacterized protein LOC119388672 n=1 Tax=Rhipicephalus sanguineus TaxID=34632 RepID=UPI0020C3DFD2|nr:uncharacterized protein LOC119388672 [Rhipicephalus sanguineus]